VRSVKLGDVLRIRFLNPVIDSEFRRALEVLTLSHDTQKKAVSLQFTGDGKRNVRVGSAFASRRRQAGASCNATTFWGASPVI
jgi:hypothetical protein